MQRSHILRELCSVLLPRHPVDTRCRFLLQLPESRLERFECYVVQERGELRILVPSCCLTYAFQRTVRTCPALSPGRVWLVHVALRQPPSLHHLRGRTAGFVRWLRRYYEAVRLPLSVHRWLWASTLPIAARLSIFARALSGSPGSRARRFSTCLGSKTARSRWCARIFAHHRVAFRVAGRRRRS